LKEVVEFYWYWRATNDYKRWTKEEFKRIREGNDGLRHYIALKDTDAQRNPRLRKRPRVDYSYSTFMSKFKEQGPYARKTQDSDSEHGNGSENEEEKKNKKKADKQNQTKKKKEKPETLVPYEVSVYADIYFPSQDLIYLQIAHPGSSVPLDNNRHLSISSDGNESENSGHNSL